MREPSSAQRRDFEGKVSNRGSMAKEKIHGRNVSNDFNGGHERDSGKKTYRGEAYKNDVDEPRFQEVDHKMISPENDLGMMRCCADFKREASGQAYGQAGEDGLRRDEKKIKAQFRPAYSDDTGY